MDRVIRVVLVDDHPIVRRGLTASLERAGDVAVVGEAASVSEARAVIDRVAPDVVLCDLRLADGDGVRLIAWLSVRGTGAPLVVTAYEDPYLVRSAVEAGARGYVLKDATEAVLHDAVRRVARGGIAFVGVGDVAGVLGSDVVLSDRERQVLELVARGRTNVEIAEALAISEATVKTHLAHVFDKVGATNRTSAVLRAMELGLIARSLEYFTKGRGAVGSGGP
ncbi:two component transcriptional regulator, LuxR family [Acidimicrobium ferrooxidans DSM 10331]|uniref:Two component transcriptional regulator, LuxR family n=1 Tax=Acidimicrobium ferrooxidans (strain DSM 10331 / JCM 15462 / NBRC 103882 / ICP) TaxID=525909 RepID=C7M1Y7_ACIFD|nr:response regulator transcription factor [Acidimicrobium ferrooxidans]ACU54884.1 two component transcriptional regulator, LuxR family [Acidimicrobium ferrooxidans DSM 10331]